MTRRKPFPGAIPWPPIAAAGGLVLLIRCTIFDLNAPTWDTHFTVPLINKTYTMGEFIEEEDELIVGEDGQVAYSLTGEIEPFEIGKYLKSDRLESQMFFYVDENYTSMNQRGTVRLSEQYQITQATVLEGSLYIETHNPTRYEVDTWYNIQDVLNFNVPGITARANEDQLHGPFDLAGAIISTDPEDRRSIRYEVTTQKVGAGPAGAGSGTIEVALRLEDVFFEEVTGILNRVDVPLDTVETEMNLPDQLEGIQFGPLTLQLIIDNGADVEAEADLLFEAVNNKGVSKTITAGGSVARNSINTLEVDGFEQIINHFPKDLYFYGNLFLGDGRDVSTVRHDDVIQGSYHSEVPLVFNIDDYVNETDPDTIELNEDTQEAFRDNLLEAYLMLEVFNHFPLGATVDLIFSKNAASLYTQNADLIKTLRLNPGEIPQHQEGTVENPLPVIGTGESVIDFGLSKEDLRVFEREKVFFGMRISFDATPGFVQVSPEDYIMVRSWIDATVHAEVPEEDEEEGGGV